MVKPLEGPADDAVREEEERLGLGVKEGCRPPRQRPGRPTRTAKGSGKRTKQRRDQAITEVVDSEEVGAAVDGGDPKKIDFFIRFIIIIFIKTAYRLAFEG